MLDALHNSGFDVLAKNHAEAILDRDFPDEIRELINALAAVSIPVAELIASGGGEAASTQRLRRILSESGWRKHNFHIETTVDGQPQGDGTSHEIDHIRRSANGVLALEIEWNNKDPFFDRDLENFQRLHAQSVISAGIIVTRGSVLQLAMRDLVRTFLAAAGIGEEQELYRFGMKERTARQRDAVRRAVSSGAPFAEAFAKQFVADKFGTATTHWEKLADRVARGVGNPCPLLLLGLPASAVTPYSAATPEL
jgi:hypothetical protein